ncbi:MAG: nitroreductase family protein [Ruminococcus flavefaciens]|nr:nitroreductase family protein [Ruminococcus flavefaciens]
MELKSCILARTSSRLFETKNIPKETLIEILDSARYAPSPKNRQPWRFLILHGDGKRAVVENFQSQKRRSTESEYLMSGELYSENNSFDIIDQAPILILVFNAYPSQKKLPLHNSDFDMMNVQSIGAAVEHILLRAADLGVSSLWLGDILSAEEFISASYPNMGKLTAGIALGYSVTPHEKTDRLAFSEIFFDYKEIKYG